jgi:outer membrane protein assembly factor BamA
MLLLVISLFGILTDTPLKQTHFSNTAIVAKSTPDNSGSATEFLTIRKISITGNTITLEKVILRELTYHTGDTLQRSALDMTIDIDKKKLINTRLFNQVEIKVDDLGSNQIDLLINVHERWYTFPGPIFKLSDRNLNDWWQNYDHDISRVNYGMKVVHANMRGRGERLGLWLQFGFQREFELKYRFPSFDRKQIQGLTIDLDFSEAKNLAYRTEDHKLLFYTSREVLKTTLGASAAYSYRKSFYNSHTVQIEYRNSTVSDSVTMFNPNYYDNESTTQKFIGVSYGFDSDHRDYVGYPLNGYRFTFDVHKSGIDRESDFHKFEIMGSLTKYFPLQYNFYLSNYTAGYWSTQQKIPYSNYKTVGYKSQIVRGYEIYVMEGPISIVNKTTFKKLLLSRKYNCQLIPVRQFRYVPFSIYLKTFADFGYVKNYPDYEVNQRLTNKPVYSFGSGVDLVGCYDIVVRLEYAFTAEGKRGLCVNVSKEF